MKTPWLKSTSVIIPYLAVLIGLYLCRNGWLALGLYHAGITAVMFLTAEEDLPKKLREGFSPIAALALAVMSALIVPIFLIFWRHMQISDTPLGVLLADFGLHGPSLLLFTVYFCTIQPLLEELYWRGHLTTHRRIFAWSDLTFAGYHLLVLACFIKPLWLIVAFIALLTAAQIWHQTAARLGGLAVPVISHIIADISIITVVHLLAD